MLSQYRSVDRGNHPPARVGRTPASFPWRLPALKSQQVNEEMHHSVCEVSRGVHCEQTVRLSTKGDEWTALPPPSSSSPSRPP
jgi:hypothetical protein